MDPPLQLEVFPVGGFVRHGDVALAHEVFGPTSVLNRVVPRRQPDGFAVSAVDLAVKEEVRGEPTPGMGIDPPEVVADYERRHHGSPIGVVHPKRDVDCGQAVEEDGDLVAEPYVLRALTDVERERGFALPGRVAVELNDPVLDREPRQRLLERPIAVEVDI